MTTITRTLSHLGNVQGDSLNYKVYETATLRGKISAKQFTMDAQVIYIYGQVFNISEKAKLIAHKIVFNNVDPDSMENFEIIASVVEFKDLPPAKIEELKKKITPNDPRYPTKFLA